MNWAVIMTGGKGTRFWPESRSRRPKPFLKLLGTKTLLEQTVTRLGPLFPPSRIVIVLQDSLVREAQRLLPRIPRKNFLGEPVGRNTAPCCVYAAAQIACRDPEARLVFLPADQHIRPSSLFRKCLRTAFQMADERPVLIGIRPDSPHTGYGYLETDRKRKINGMWAFRVRQFREKPDLAEARRFLKRGNFFWNGGTFVWRLDAFQQSVCKYAPKIYSSWEALSKVAPGHVSLRRRIYNKLPAISIDYAVMEKLKNVHGLLAPFQLKDLGGWEGISEFWNKDKFGNRLAGDSSPRPIFADSRRNIVKSGQRLIALVGASDLVVVDTPDALLICRLSETEKIRNVVRELEKRKASRYL